MGLVVAMTSLAVVFDGWLWEVDLLCRTLVGWFIFVIPVCWPDTQTSVYKSRGWYCPDILRARQGWGWRSPWNVLLYGCASPDRYLLH